MQGAWPPWQTLFISPLLPAHYSTAHYLTLIQTLQRCPFSSGLKAWFHLVGIDLIQLYSHNVSERFLVHRESCNCSSRNSLKQTKRQNIQVRHSQQNQTNKCCKDYNNRYCFFQGTIKSNRHPCFVTTCDFQHYLSQILVSGVGKISAGFYL